jgi:ubiquinone biosynthesis protein
MGLFSFLSKELGYFRRFNTIIRVLAKYGFEDMVSYLTAHRRFPSLRRLIPKRTYNRSVTLTKWERMRMVCEELGPTFVKFGQILSNRPDLLPQELILELEKLQDGVPPEPSNVAIGVIESELGGKVDDIFDDFNAKALASASIAQVHRGRLLTGEEIVVKVQRPGIAETIKSDLRAMYMVAEILNKRVPEIRNYDPIGLVKMFEESILREMDFVHESINIQRFRANHEQDDKTKHEIYVPLVFQPLTTDKVLTMEFISGIKISDYEQLQLGGFDRKLVAKRLINSYLRQVFDHGFFHADPHPGNIFVLPGNVVCFIDYGMMGNLIPRDLENLATMFLAVKAKDVKKIIRTLLLLSDKTVIRNYRELEYDITEFVHSYEVNRFHRNEMGSLMLSMKDIVLKHGLKVPVHFFLLARSLFTVEGVARNLDPEIDVTELARPFMIKVVGRKYNPLEFGKRMLNAVFEMGTYMEDFPRDLKNAIRKINTGEIKVDIQHKGIDPVVHTIHRVSKQIVSAVIISGLVIGSSLLIVAQVPPKWKDTSVWGIIGLSIAVLIGLGMLNNLRKGDNEG